MYKNDYHQKSIGKLVTLPFTAKVQGKWWNAESNKLCLHHFNIPSLDIIPVLEMIYFFTMNSIPWRWGGNKKYIIKRTLSNIRGDGLVRLLWDTAEVWVYYIWYLHPSDYFKYINEFNFITKITFHTSTATTSLIECKAYFDWISGHFINSTHPITLLQHITCTKFSTGEPICTGIPSKKIQYYWHVIAGLLHIL